MIKRINKKQMAEATDEVDERKYSKGNRIISIYHDVHLPNKPINLADMMRSLMDFKIESLRANGFTILNVKPYPGLGDSLIPGEKLIVGTTLSESEDISIYDPILRNLFCSLNTCSPEKDGSLMLKKQTELLGKEPTIYMLPEIVDKQLAYEKESQYMFNSVEDAVRSLNLRPDKKYCISVVFFDVNDSKLEEDSLDSMFTKVLNRQDQKPSGEDTQRYFGQGHTYMHFSPRHIVAAHSYPKALKSEDLTIIGNGENLEYVVLDLGQEIYKGKKSGYALRAKIIAEDI